MKNLKFFLITLVASAIAIASAVAWADSEDLKTSIRWYGTASSGQDLFETGQWKSAYGSFTHCTVQSTDGSVSIYAALDGEDYSTEAMKLEVMSGSTEDETVTATVEGALYRFAFIAKRYKATAIGGTATASMLCW